MSAKVPPLEQPLPCSPPAWLALALLAGPSVRLPASSWPSTSERTPRHLQRLVHRLLHHADSLSRPANPLSPIAWAVCPRLRHELFDTDRDHRHRKGTDTVCSPRAAKGHQDNVSIRVKLATNMYTQRGVGMHDNGCFMARGTVRIQADAPSTDSVLK